MQNIDKLRNLLVMAASDGSLNQQEILYLTERCREWGIPEADFAEAIQYALSKSAELTIPVRKIERLRMLADMMSMMAADGDLAEMERELFAVIAAKMEVSERELNEVIDSLTSAKERRGSA